MKIVGQIFVLILSIFTISCTSKVKDDETSVESSNAAFIVNEVTAQELTKSSNSQNPLLVLRTQGKKLSLQACLTDIALGEPVRSQIFEVKTEKVNMNLQTDSNGCLFWNETLILADLEKGLFYKNELTITGMGQYKGVVTFPLGYQIMENGNAVVLDLRKQGTPALRSEYNFKLNKIEWIEDKVSPSSEKGMVDIQSIFGICLEDNYNNNPLVRESLEIDLKISNGLFPELNDPGQRLIPQNDEEGCYIFSYFHRERTNLASSKVNLAMSIKGLEIPFTGKNLFTEFTLKTEVNSNKVVRSVVEKDSGPELFVNKAQGEIESEDGKNSTSNEEVLNTHSLFASDVNIKIHNIQNDQLTIDRYFNLALSQNFTLSFTPKYIIPFDEVTRGRKKEVIEEGKFKIRIAILKKKTGQLHIESFDPQNIADYQLILGTETTAESFDGKVHGLFNLKYDFTQMPLLSDKSLLLAEVVGIDSNTAQFAPTVIVSEFSAFGRSLFGLPPQLSNPLSRIADAQKLKPVFDEILLLNAKSKKNKWKGSPFQLFLDFKNFSNRENPVLVSDSNSYHNYRRTNPSKTKCRSNMNESANHEESIFCLQQSEGDFNKIHKALQKLEDHSTTENLKNSLRHKSSFKHLENLCHLFYTQDFKNGSYAGSYQLSKGHSKIIEMAIKKKKLPRLTQCLDDPLKYLRILPTKHIVNFDYINDDLELEKVSGPVKVNKLPGVLPYQFSITNRALTARGDRENIGSGHRGDIGIGIPLLKALPIKGGSSMYYYKENMEYNDQSNGVLSGRTINFRVTKQDVSFKANIKKCLLVTSKKVLEESFLGNEKEGSYQRDSVFVSHSVGNDNKSLVANLEYSDEKYAYHQDRHLICNKNNTPGYQIQESFFFYEEIGENEDTPLAQQGFVKIIRGLTNVTNFHRTMDMGHYSKVSFPLTRELNDMGQFFPKANPEAQRLKNFIKSVYNTEDFGLPFYNDSMIPGTWY